MNAITCDLALPSARALALRAEPLRVSSLRASIANAERARLLRKAELLTRRHTEMARLDAPAIARLGWMKMYRDAANVVFKRLHALRIAQ